MTAPANIPAAWNALYPSPVPGALPLSKGQAPNSTDAAAYGSLGVDPSALAMPTPPVDPFAPKPQAAPIAPADGFGKGAVPFSFAGPGSNVVNPSQIMRPAPPVAAPVAAATPTDASSRNRAPDDFIPVGNYQMPAFRGGAPALAAVADDEESAPAAAPAARAPIAAAPAAPASAPFSLAGAGAGVGDRFGKATRGFLGNLGNGPIGALAGGLGALITGQNTDPSSIAAEQNSLTAQALLKKGASAAEVQAARYNPALQKALIDQYYGKDKWAVVQVGEDGDGRKQFMQQNQVDGTLRPIAGASVGAGGGASDTVTGPDGKPIQIPPGLTGAARKEFVKRVAEASADAATGKQNGEQAKSAKFATIATQADSVIKQLEAQGQSVWGPISDKLPLGSAYLQSPEYQKYKAAKEAFLGAHLRDVSGAAIGSNEYVRAEKTFFPQPGEGPEVVAQKAALRAQLLHEMGRSAGLGYKPPAAPAASGKTSSGVSWSVN
ncbi:hypothetical protein [Bradyrhizobium sp. th.b2]|uniref:hypothetical protein n=1 Tax=Bradyrhizobium sp. th-b2 TaxID=172088 RepID=UPI00048C959D|nr:hypothetical protein [Bradyrhizobium sp. th.b2]